MGLDQYLYKKTSVSGISGTINEDKWHCNVTITSLSKKGDTTIESYSETNPLQKKEIYLKTIYDIDRICTTNGEEFDCSTIEELKPSSITIRGCKEKPVDEDEFKNHTLKISEISELTYEYAYWRKANQVHNWFVENIQNGKDDCGCYEVSGEKLIELRNLCSKILNNKEDKELAEGGLPTRSGFFFGGTEYDDYYYEDLESTIKQLAHVQPDETYYYQSSW